jgi:hypothetical protein
MAMCPVEGALVLMADSTRKPIETLKKGDLLMGIDHKPDQLLDDPQPSVQEVCEVSASYLKAKVSLTHAFERDAGGYSIAAGSKGDKVLASLEENGRRYTVAVEVDDVKLTGARQICFHLFLRRSHGFNADGFWGLE